MWLENCELAKLFSRHELGSLKKCSLVPHNLLQCNSWEDLRNHVKKSPEKRIVRWENSVIPWYEKSLRNKYVRADNKSDSARLRLFARGMVKVKVISDSKAQFSKNFVSGSVCTRIKLCTQVNRLNRSQYPWQRDTFDLMNNYSGSLKSLSVKYYNQRPKTRNHTSMTHRHSTWSRKRL